MCAFSVCRNNGSPLFLLQNMCITFLGFDGDKELVSLPKSLLFSCFKKQRIFSENSRTLCSFVSFFIFLIYLHISVRKVEESGNFLIGWLLIFVIYKVPSSSRYYRRKASLRHSKGKLLCFVSRVNVCPVGLLFGMISDCTALSFCPLPWRSFAHRTGR